MTYKSITLTAYLPSAERELVHPFHVLPLPGTLREAFAEFHRTRFSKPDEHLNESFPIKRLNSVLAAAAPDIISVAAPVAVEDDAPWLFAHRPVDQLLISGILKLWLNRTKPVSSGAIDPTDTFDLIDATPLTWEEQHIDLRKQTVNAQSTAEPAPRLYHLLPDFLARRIRAAGPFIGGNGQAHHFLETPGSTRRAELVSWPPAVDEAGGTGARFSYVITISVQTIPFTDRFRVHVRTGVRRWMDTPGPGGTLYTGRRSVSVHLLTRSPFTGASVERDRIAVNRLRYRSKEGAHVWSITDGPDLPPGANVLPRMPDARELVTDPGRWLDGVDGVFAAIPYNTGMGSHAIGAGLMAGDRVPLMELIDDALAPLMERAPVCKRLPVPNHPSNHPGTPGGAKADTPEWSVEVRERRDRLREFAGDTPFVVRVHWQEQETRDALVSALRELLDLPPEESAGDDLSWSLPGLELRVQLRPSGPLASPLDIGARTKISKEDLRKAIGQRRGEAEATMGDGPKKDTILPTVALVEIEAEFKDARTDPKFAVRLGCADAGAVTQFIQTAETSDLKKNRAYRARACWLDAFRQLGVSRVPLHTFRDSLPPDLQYVSVWMAKRRWDGPTRTPTWRLLALRVRPEDGVNAVSGWHSDERRWVSYPEYLRWLASGADPEEVADIQLGASEEEQAAEEPTAPERQTSKPRKETRWERRLRTNALLRPMVAQLKERPTLLMTHAQNLRDSWTWLRNGDVERDRIRLGDAEEETVPIEHWGGGLRLIRVRDNAEDETPQWYGTGRDNGLPAGIWPLVDAPDQRVFYSSTDRPVTYSKASVAARREGKRTTEHGNVSDAKKDARNPNLLEIAVLACRSGAGADDPHEWAACAHQMRYAPDLQAPLTLPYPLHMAKLAAEYVLPTSEE
ncbi:pPIWI_RE module domain-containing protein [Nocardiopsis chromatogenes]|uniref:pPIWI_RE module domain-containing protein n=1 Tax=Nocardiopsis chromatogenes TaxID=280239 RepID=UPI00034BB0A0|nr:DUF3962 domain-containing protein [Nocardiopsis chromatogenes]